MNSIGNRIKHVHARAVFVLLMTLGSLSACAPTENTSWQAATTYVGGDGSVQAMGPSGPIGP